MRMTIPVAVLGASGYTGAELLRLLAEHPDVEVVVATADSQAGVDVGELYPHLQAYGDLPMRTIDDATDDIAACRLVFCGLPHGEAMRVLPGLDNDLVVDLGGDFRLDDPSEYARWYGTTHAAPDDLDAWVYGLPELLREDIAGADRIANPGCYPTAATLAIAPLLAAGMIEGPVVVDAASGTSGAGRGPKPDLHFAHVFEDVRAYKIAAHQHTPEIEHALELATGRQCRVSFTAHLVPMVRGIHATVSAQLAPGADPGQVADLFADNYGDEEFVAVSATPPGTKQVRGSNMCVLHPAVDLRCGRVIVTSVIDNLVKGAAGQAVQNANIALGLDEGTGLPVEGLYP